MPLNLFIAGANGGIGRHVVEQSLQAGHRVIALVRDPAKLPLVHPNLEIIKGNVMQPLTFAHQLKNMDVAISALGASGGLFGDKRTVLYSQGNTNLLNAMQAHGVSRGFFISASAIEISPVLPFYARFAAKYVLQKLLKHMYHDLRLMENIIKNSDTEWTIIRPPQLTNGDVTGNYRVGINQFLENSLKISRGDVAHFILKNITNEAIFKTTVEIGY